MNKAEFAHVVRAACAVVGVKQALIIGSQAAHATVTSDFIPGDFSGEVDVAFFNDRDNAAADLVDGSIGEGSLFHERFGYYGQGVSERTAHLPQGWRDRLAPYEDSGTAGCVAYCLEIHDLWLSKAWAGREKDVSFCDTMAEQGLVDPNVLRDRLPQMPGLSDDRRQLMIARIARAERLCPNSGERAP